MYSCHSFEGVHTLYSEFAVWQVLFPLEAKERTQQRSLVWLYKSYYATRASRKQELSCHNSSMCVIKLNKTPDFCDHRAKFGITEQFGVYFVITERFGENFVIKEQFRGNSWLQTNWEQISWTQSNIHQSQGLQQRKTLKIPSVQHSIPTKIPNFQ